ncbi:Protein CBG25804 [Caenorhabditis briggsae]|uniref:Protein CBG25804 n=1 Tax=Caenorhabditis briggsae TaxID=6238 RepID=B6IJU7_CAEBR|nr:Protein CBG25804 [Caenorhabditis briggsae]CAS00177.1 Protein CBG25804 [Caenorhabditis briggsae]
MANFSENTENSDPGENQCAEKPKAKSAGSAPFRSFDLKQLSSEMKRMADGGKLFNMMREVDRMGGMRGLMRRRGRGGVQKFL